MFSIETLLPQVKNYGEGRVTNDSDSLNARGVFHGACGLFSVGGYILCPSESLK